MSTTQQALAPHQARSSAHSYRILVASDGLPASLGAIRVALALTRRKTADVTVLTVAAPFPHAVPTGFQIAPPSTVDEDNRQSALETLRHQLASVRGTTGWVVRATTGWPADCILTAAHNLSASLIVIGLGEHGAVDRLFGSETAVAIAKRSTIPVLAIPPHVTHLPMHAAVAVDFTEASVNAATVAAGLLGANGRVTLVHASTLINANSESGSLPDVYAAGAMAKLAMIRDRLHRETKRRVEIALVNDEIIGGLLSFVEHARCDLLALGGHDMGLVDRFLLGSTRTRVLRHAHTPVLIVPHTSEQE